jgi:hypothetical protein
MQTLIIDTELGLVDPEEADGKFALQETKNPPRLSQLEESGLVHVTASGSAGEIVVAGPTPAGAAAPVAIGEVVERESNSAIPCLIIET